MLIITAHNDFVLQRTGPFTGYPEEFVGLYKTVPVRLGPRRDNQIGYRISIHDVSWKVTDSTDLHDIKAEIIAYIDAQRVDTEPSLDDYLEAFNLDN